MLKTISRQLARADAFLRSPASPRPQLRRSHIIAPRPSIRWCPVHRRPPTTNMAAGDVLLDSSGNVILDSSGNVMLDDGAGNMCVCGYIQAKKCSDNTTADLWKPLCGATLPYYFSKSGVCYYMQTGNATSLTPGTILTGETSISGCSDSSCIPSCTDCPDTTPSQYTVAFSGVSFCACTGATATTGTLGTYCLSQTSNPCVWQAAATGVTMTHHLFLGCGGSVTSSGSPGVFLSRSGSVWRLCVSDGISMCFLGVATKTNCADSFTSSNSLITTCTTTNNQSPGCVNSTELVCGSGGTAAVAASC